ncbi:Transmembrane protein [Trema orientale]|uniref:Transmembrane protein n=1 Tax=Trema orientale TaxID=63057 RepID=A0A2P5C215_TREOI|nr:Transmembrane protein [Trema orientale]
MDNVKDTNNSSKKAVKKFLLSVSVSAISFTFMFSYSSLLVPFFFNSFTNAYFSAFTKQPSSFTTLTTLDKSYVFLLFNGILVILVKNSGLIGNISPELDSKTNDVVSPSSSTVLIKTTPVKPSFDSEQVKDDHDEEKERELNDTNEEEEEGEEEEEEEEEGVGLPSSEEFNKKCDEFIRRVKEEIMLGALYIQ